MKNRKLAVCAALVAALSAVAVTGCSDGQGTAAEAPSETVVAAYDVYDTSEGVAATVNGVEIGEKSITAYVDSKRELFGMTDDDSWNQYLVSMESTPEELRRQIIESYVKNEEIRQAAAAQGIEVTEEEVDRAVQSLKDQYGNESSWRIYLKQTGQTDYDVREQQRLSLLNKKLYYLATGSSELEDMVDQITGQMLASAASPEELTALQKEQEALPEDASQEQKDELQARIDAEQAKAQESYASVLELVELIDGGIAALKGSMGTPTYEATDEQVLEYIRASDESLAGTESLEGLPDSIIMYLREQLTNQNKAQAAADFLAEYTDGATVVINDAPEGLSYFIEVVPADGDGQAVATAETAE